LELKNNIIETGNIIKTDNNMEIDLLGKGIVKKREISERAERIKRKNKRKYLQYVNKKSKWQYKK
jgi:hypothetical protein